MTTELVTDEWGNTTQATVRSSGRCTASQHIFAAPDIEAWAIGRLLRSAVRTTASEDDCAIGAPGDAATRTAAFEYYADGQFKREVVEPDDPASCVATEYEYDSFGNATAEDHAQLQRHERFSSGESRGGCALRRGALRAA